MLWVLGLGSVLALGSLYGRAHGLEWIPAVLLLTLLTSATATDLMERRIPNQLCIYGAAAALIVRWWIPVPGYGIVASLIGGVVAFTVFFLLMVVSRGGIGAGDVKLYAVVGLFVGWKVVLLSFLLTAISGMLTALLMMGLKRATKESYLPYAPSIALGSWIAYVGSM